MSRRDPRATREALESVARELFATRGFEEARTRDIAERAGVNKAMINYHYGGKQGLFSAVVAEGIAAGHERLGDCIDPERPATEQLRDFIAAFARFGREHPEFVLTIVREQMNGGRHLEPELLERFAGFFLQTRQILEAGVRDGSLRPVDPHMTHLSLVGSLVYYLLTEPARRAYAERGGLPATAPGPEQYVAHVTELFLRGLTPDDSGETTSSTPRQENAP